MTFIQNLQSESSLFKIVLLSAIAFTLGFGIYPLVIPALLIAIIGVYWSGFSYPISNLQKISHKPGYLFFLAAVGFFFSCYRGFYLPYNPEILVMPWNYFQVLFTLSFFTLLCIALFEKEVELISFIWLFCLGSLFFCLTTVFFAMWLQKPPFYAAIIDIRYLPFGIQKFINTPGIANLLSLFPAAFLAALLLKKNQRPRCFWSLGVAGFLLSLTAAFALGQRSYFVIVLVIEPIVVALFLLLLRSWAEFIAICSLLLSYPLLRLLDQALGINFLYRPLDQSLFNDSRFQMFEYWLEHVTIDPFKRVEVGPAPWDSLQWFHNFFADIHRLSGFWALLAAVSLISYIFIRLLYLIRVDRRLGLFLIAIAIPCFLIMNTSVVPEGERQPFLLLLAIGAISEVILARFRDVSQLPQIHKTLNKEIDKA